MSFAEQTPHERSGKTTAGQNIFWPKTCPGVEKVNGRKESRNPKDGTSGGEGQKIGVSLGSALPP